MGAGGRDQRSRESRRAERSEDAAERAIAPEKNMQIVRFAGGFMPRFFRKRYVEIHEIIILA